MLAAASSAWDIVLAPFRSTELFQLLPLVAALVALLFLRTEITAAKLPPGPPSNRRLGWFLGHAIPQPYSWRYFELLTMEYGPAFTIYIGMTPTIIVGSYDAAMEIMERQAGATADRPTSIMAGESMSGGKRILLVKHSDRWRRLRKMLHQGLQPKMAALYEPIQEKGAQQLILDICNRPDDFQVHAKTYAASVILSIAYGKMTPTTYSDPDVIAVNTCLERLGRCVRPGTYIVDAFPLLRYLPFDIQNWKADSKRWHAEELALFSKQLDGVREDLRLGQGVDCFGRYLIEHQKEYDLSNDEAAYLAGSMFGAGSDTTASAISIAIMALALYPDVAKAVQAELDAVIGRTRPPGFSDYQDLPYVQAFVKEVHRWRPVSSGGFAHTVTEQIVYRGKIIPKGASIVGNHWSISRDPLVFMDPEEFRPARWFVDEDSEAKVLRKDINHVAWGFGRRVCAGKNIADRSVFINCAMLLWSFEISKKRDKDGVEIEIDSLAFTNSANCHPLPYSASFAPRFKGVQDIIEGLH